MEIFKLFGSILVDNDKANQSISKTEKKADGLSTRLGKGIKTAAKWGAGLAAGAVAAGAGMLALTIKVGNTADEILDLNSITGMTTDSIQQWRKVTEVAGVAQDAMTNASKKLTKSLDAMSVEGQKGSEALGKLGFSLEDIEAMNADEQMNALTQALAEVDDKTERARIGTDLFGGSWAEIAPVVDLGTEAMLKAKDSANIISEEDLKKANDFRISVADMKDQVSFFATEIGIALLPMFQGLFNWIQLNMPTIKQVTKTVFDAIQTGISYVVEWISKLISWLSEWFENNEETLTGIQDKFNELFEALMVFIQAFIDWAKEAWELYGEDILNILQAAWDQITNIFNTAIDLITEIFNAFSALFNGDWGALWESVKNILNIALDFVKESIKNAINIILALFGTDLATVKDKVSEIFNGIKDAIKGIMQNIVNGIYGGMNFVIRGLNFFIGRVNRILKSMNEVPGVSLPTISTVDELDVPQLAEGGNILNDGAVMVGEQGPEILSNIKGAMVTPLDKAEQQIVININNPTLFNDRDADKLGELVVSRLRTLGVKP